MTSRQTGMFVKRFYATASNTHQQLFKQAAQAISEADAVYITAGAGMGVDSGLPDFRSNKGFWKAYPPLQKLNIKFTDMANPQWFDTKPNIAWGFYGHRLKLYESTIPHNGYKMLLEMANTCPYGYFVYTSNVDGHFFKAGYDRYKVVECHGSIHYLQCTDGSCMTCQQIDNGTGIISIQKLCELNGIDYKNEWLNNLQIDENTFTVTDDMIPKCLMKFIGKKCFIGNDIIARPNILMFGDYGFKTERVYEQYQRLEDWKRELRLNKAKNICVIEMGAGSAVPRVRYDSESAASWDMVNTFIRINISPSESNINTTLPANKIELPFGALFAIQSIFDHWNVLKQ
eukprot:121642_1